MTLLSAEDVLNKKFQPTKFREGYDQDEVDDFLDDVVSTLRALTTENEQLKSNLAAAQARVDELSASSGQGATAAAAPVASQQDEPQQAEPERPAEPEPAAPRDQPVSAADEPESAASMLALARRVHDEYVRNGQLESERLVGEARSTAEGLLHDAEEQRATTLGQLEEEKALLEQKIEELQTFERDYRSRLKAYLEGLLHDVEGAEAGSSEATPRSID